MDATCQQTIWEDLTAGESLDSLIRQSRNPHRFQQEMKTLIDSFYKHGSRIIEVGCSTGITSFILNDKFDRTLLDLNSEAIALSQALFKHFQKKATFIVGDMFRMALPDESFDVVFNSGVVEHFEYADRVNALKEYGRILKSEGVLLVAFPNHFSKPYKRAYQYLNKRGKWPYPKEIALYDMRQELSEAGFRLRERLVFDRKTPLDYCAHFPLGGRLVKVFYALSGYEGYLTAITAVKL